MNQEQGVDQLRALIRNVADFPKPGIVFKDFTPLLADPRGLALAVELMANPYRGTGVEVVVGAESRGFIFGGALAHQLKAGFVPVRKRGKLPGPTLEEECELEYGRDVLAIHEDAIQPGQKVLVVDDLLATGGTMAATLRLVERLGGKVVGTAFLIELAFLKGRDRLRGYDVDALITYD